MDHVWGTRAVDFLDTLVGVAWTHWERPIILKIKNAEENDFWKGLWCGLHNGLAKMISKLTSWACNPRVYSGNIKKTAFLSLNS